MSESKTKLACPHLIRSSSSGYSLVGSRCEDCGEVYFPNTQNCTRCLSSRIAPFELGGEGILWSWTIQDFLPKTPYNSGETEADFKPYGVGYVQMPSGVKVESRLSVADPEALQIGMPLRLEILPYGKSPAGEVLTSFAFSPLKSGKVGDSHGK